MMVDTANQSPQYVYPLCRALEAAGCVVDLVTAPYTYDELPAFGISAHETFARANRLPPVRRYQRLRRVTRALEYPLDWAAALGRVYRTQPDAVHVQWAMLPPVDALAFRAIRRAGARLVYTVHDIRLQNENWLRSLLTTRSLYRRADELVVHTEASREALCAAVGLPQSRVHVMPHGNLLDWAGPPVRRDQARARLTLPAEASLVLFFGGIRRYKRLDLLIEALPQVLALQPRSRLLIAGRPDGSFARYQEAIDRLGLSDYVIKRLGYVPEKRVVDYFCAADVVVLPYDHENFSSVLMTAYTYGRPVVATDTKGLRELVARDGTGHIVPVGDVQALSEAILSLLSDPEQATRMGERGRERALTDYSWSNSARVMLRVYQGSGQGSDEDHSRG
jgi:glycosyltransferase involved in cell wall biosynthesis